MPRRDCEKTLNTLHEKMTEPIMSKEPIDTTETADEGADHEHHKRLLSESERREVGRIGNLNGKWAMLLKLNLSLVPILVSGLIALSAFLLRGHFDHERDLSVQKEMLQPVKEQVARNAMELKAREPLTTTVSNLSIDLNYIKRDQDTIKDDLKDSKRLLEETVRKVDLILAKGRDGG